MATKQEILIKIDEKSVQKFSDLKENLTELTSAINTKFSQTLEKLTTGVERLNTALSNLRNIGTGSTTTVRQTTNVSKTLPSRGDTSVHYVPPKNNIINKLKGGGFASDAISTAIGTGASLKGKKGLGGTTINIAGDSLKEKTGLGSTTIGTGASLKGKKGLGGTTINIAGDSLKEKTGLGSTTIGTEASTGQRVRAGIPKRLIEKAKNTGEYFERLTESLLRRPSYKKDQHIKDYLKDARKPVEVIKDLVEHINSSGGVSGKVPANIPGKKTGSNFMNLVTETENVSDTKTKPVSDTETPAKPSWLRRVGDRSKQAGRYLVSKTGRAGRFAARAGRFATSPFRGLGRPNKGLSAVGLGGLARWGIRGYIARKVFDVGRDFYLQHADYEQAERQLRTIYGREDYKRGDKVFKRAVEIARSTPLSLGNVLRATSKLAAYGISGRRVGSTIEKLGNIARGNPQSLETAATVFGRVSRLGYLQGMERNMLVDATGFDPLTTYAKLKGLETSDVFDMMRKREFTIDKFIEALDNATGPVGRFNNLLDDMSKTAKGQLQIFESNWKLFKAKGGALLATLVNPALQAANAALTSVKNKGTSLDEIDFGKVKVKDVKTGDSISVYAHNPFGKFGKLNYQNIFSAKDTLSRRLLKSEAMSPALDSLYNAIIPEKDRKPRLTEDGFYNDYRFDQIRWKLQGDELYQRIADEKGNIKKIKLKTIDSISKKRKIARYQYGAESAQFKAQDSVYNLITGSGKDIQVSPAQLAVNTFLHAWTKFLFGTTEEPKTKKVEEDKEEEDKIISGGTRPRTINIHIDEMIGIKDLKTATVEENLENLTSQVTSLLNQVLRNVSTMA